VSAETPGATAWTVGVLAGGRSRRLGRDKAGLLLPDGQSFLDAIVRRHAGGVRPVLVATRRGGPGADGSHRTVFDVEAGAGPLAGIVALLGACRTPLLLVLPCDAPLLPAELGARLAQALPAEAQGIVLETESGVQPLPAMIRSAAASSIARHFEAGARKALAWVDAVPAAIRPFAQILPGLDPALLSIDADDEAGYLEILRRWSEGSDR
jgi:molybdopterin-guanine dinucleotide biosynthesis protein A